MSHLNILPGGEIDVSNPGYITTPGDLAPVLPGSDCTIALNALIAVWPDFTTLVFNLGGYVLNTSTIELNVGGRTTVWMRGAGSNGGSGFTGNIAGPLLAWNLAGAAVQANIDIEGFDFSNFNANANAAGCGLYLDGINGARLADLTFGQGYRGLVIGKKTLDTFNVDVGIYDVVCNNNYTAYPDGRGMSLNMMGGLYNVAGYQCGDAAYQLSGYIGVFRMHIEVCNRCVRTGLDPNDAAVSSYILIDHITTEASIVPLEIGGGTVSLEAHTWITHGSGNIYQAGPVYCVNALSGAGAVTFVNATFGGSFSSATVDIDPGVSGPFVFINSAVANNHASPAVVWDTVGYTGTVTGIQTPGTP